MDAAEALDDKFRDAECMALCSAGAFPGSFAKEQAKRDLENLEKLETWAYRALLYTEYNIYI